MKTRIIVASACVVLGFSTACFAIDSSKARSASGVYVDAAAGYGNVDQGPSSETSGGAGKVDLGYQILSFLGLEGGATLHTDIKDTNSGNYVLDLVAKLTLPIFSSPFSVFAKGGPAWVTSKPDGGSRNSKILPYGAAGLALQLSSPFSAYVEVAASPKSDSDSGDNVPAMYTALLGISYKFGL